MWTDERSPTSGATPTAGIGLLTRSPAVPAESGAGDTDACATDTRRSRRDLLANLAAPPAGDHRFWFAQGLVAIVLIVYLLADLAQDRGMIGVPGFVWLLALFLPVVYAGSVFGLVGSFAVAVEASALVAPYSLLTPHSGMARWGIWSILTMIFLCALLLGDRFEEERGRQARLLRAERDRIAEYLEGHPLSWRCLLDMIPDGMALIDEDGAVRFANERLGELSGRLREELLGVRVAALVPAPAGERQDGCDEALLERPGHATACTECAATLVRADGEELPVNVLLAPVSMDGSPWALAMVRDERARRAAEQARLEAELRLRLTFESSMDGIVLVDLEDRLLQVNPAFCAMVGYGEAELLGPDPPVVTHPADAAIRHNAHARLLAGELPGASYTKRYVHRDGRVLWVEVQAAPAHDPDGAIAYFVCTVRDVTSHHVLTSQLSHQALHDPLTGLANRRLFEERLTDALARAASGNGIVAAMLLDLDDFKAVNDTLGHHVGDELLVVLARRLERVARAGDTVARLGGDEFLYLAEGLRSPAEAMELARRLLGALSASFHLDGHRLSQRASLGIALYPSPEETGLTGRTSARDLLRNADIALYEAKRQGKACPVLFVKAMRERVASRFELTQELEQAHARRELSLYYQPIVALGSGDLAGFEALMRWKHPIWGLVPPDRFIPVAEQTELIFELGAFALREAVSQAASWREAGSRSSSAGVAVNLSPRQLYAPNLIADVIQLLSERGLAAGRLVIEVTESTVLSDVDTATRVIDALRRLGAQVALDDFGTGYSSLSSLMLLRPSIIKIDRSFVSPAQPLPSASTMLEAIVSLAHKLGMAVVAEGIETREQLAHLQALGCDLGQGYLFSPPLPAGDVDSLLGPTPVRAAWLEHLGARQHDPEPRPDAGCRGGG